MSNTHINYIKSQYSDINQWNIQYPWFSISHLIDTSYKKGSASFIKTSQKAVIFFNDIHRFHWLIHQQEININAIIAAYSIEKENIATNNTSKKEAYNINIVEEKSNIELLNQSLAKAADNFKNEKDTQEELSILSKPYHTIDYFASQGIKSEQDSKADDKFGQQLKSFTSWLKQMKRLPLTTLAEKKYDVEVENIAIHSLQESEVITESMAEVLIKQGKKEQAIQIFKKLSLLYPEKSTYFATQIEQLKS